MITKNLKGKISYIGADGAERGREWFSFTHSQDGQHTLRAYNEIDDTEVQRDVVYTMDANWRPLDCFNRLHVKGKFLGTGWMRFTPTLAECEVYNVEIGRSNQRFELARPAQSLGAHPLTCDVLHLSQFDHKRPEKIQSIDGTWMTSPLPNGASGPWLANETLTMEYLGPEKLTVPAGTFDAHHYRFVLPPNADGSPRSEECWCRHPDYLFLKVEVRGFLKNSRYVLTSLTEGEV
jgi:hypothetical protein